MQVRGEGENLGGISIFVVQIGRPARITCATYRDFMSVLLVFIRRYDHTNHIITQIPIAG